jgi:hypothetical protein
MRLEEVFFHFCLASYIFAVLLAKYRVGSEIPVHRATASQCSFSLYHSLNWCANTFVELIRVQRISRNAQIRSNQRAICFDC